MEESKKRAKGIQRWTVDQFDGATLSRCGVERGAQDDQGKCISDKLAQHRKAVVLERMNNVESISLNSLHDILFF